MKAEWEAEGYVNLRSENEDVLAMIVMMVGGSKRFHVMEGLCGQCSIALVCCPSYLASKSVIGLG